MKRLFLFVFSIFLFLSAKNLYAAEDPNYMIKGRDVLKISVYDHPDLKVEVRVTEAGTITFPLIGEVEIKGLTSPQVEKKLRTLLAKGYIVNPQVNVFVEQFKIRRVTVMGEVVKPGQYDMAMEEPTYIADIISKCSGLTKDAGQSLTILRKSGGDKTKLSVDLPKLLKEGELTQNIAVEEGDLIYVPRAGFFYIYGEVARPGFYRIEPGLTLIKAISTAGGPTQAASTMGSKIIRKTDNVETTIGVELYNPLLPGDEFFKGGDLSQNIKIEDEDVIYVPRAAYFYVYGEVNRPGHYKIEPGLTIIRAISMAGGVNDKASTGRIKVKRKIKDKEETISSDLDQPVQGEDVIIVPESYF